MNDGPIPNLDALMQIAERLHIVGQKDARLAAAEPGDLIRNVAGKRAIFEGVFEGRDVVFRLNYHPEDGAPAREWEEMERLWPYMAEGDLRIAEPIYANTDAGVIVLERVSASVSSALISNINMLADNKQHASGAFWSTRWSTGVDPRPKAQEPC